MPELYYDESMAKYPEAEILTHAGHEAVCPAWGIPAVYEEMLAEIAEG